MSSDPDVYPYDTVAYITDTIAGQVWQGSGVLISPDEVLTASHVVYKANDGAATNITVRLGYNAGTVGIGSAPAQAVHYNAVQDGDETLTNEQSQYDYAVIHLSTPFTGVGTMGLESNFTGGPANVSGYPAAAGGQLQTSQQTITRQPGLTLLDGTSIGAGSSGGPVWVTGSDGQPYVAGVVSTAAGAIGSQGYFTQISTTAFNQIEAWVAQDDGPTSGTPVTVLDNATGQQFAPVPAPYAGPVQELTSQYISTTSDSLNITAATPGWFIRGGTGTNAITVSSGTNVLDGGSASSFMTGGTGSDTFYADVRGASVNFWDTINGFHAGDVATIWGVTQAGFNLEWADSQGAPGHLGLTLHAASSGGTNAALTLAGFSQDDLLSGRLAISFGAAPDGGPAYMRIAANT